MPKSHKTILISSQMMVNARIILTLLYLSIASSYNMEKLLAHAAQARREGGRAERVTVWGHRGARGSELSGLECKIHQLKLRPADAMINATFLFFWCNNLIF